MGWYHMRNFKKMLRLHAFNLGLGKKKGYIPSVSSRSSVEQERCRNLRPLILIVRHICCRCLTTKTEGDRVTGCEKSNGFSLVSKRFDVLLVSTSPVHHPLCWLLYYRKPRDAERAEQVETPEKAISH